MNLLVGLGNPGAEYCSTRHNAGFLLVEKVQEKFALPKLSLQKKFQAEVARGQIKGEDWLLAQPQTFMNLSGMAVRALVQFYRLEPSTQLFVAFDDLDLPVGQAKIQFGKGPHGHNGLESIYQSLGTKDFTHLRIGVDGRAGERLIVPRDYVLTKFPPSEKELLDQTLENLLTQLF